MRKDTMHATVAQTTCHIAFFQETKLDFIDHQKASYIGGHHFRSFAHLLAIGTWVLLLWGEDHIFIKNIHIGTHLLSVDVNIRSCGASFKITTVYGPSSDTKRGTFLKKQLPPNLLRQKPNG
jgi:hypothetical protein